MVYNNEPPSRVISDIEAKFAVKISFKGSSNIESAHLPRQFEKQYLWKK